MSPRIRNEQASDNILNQPLTIFSGQGGALAVNQSEAVQLAGQGMACDVCGCYAMEFWACSMCGLQGHRDCLRITFLAGYAFCSGCSSQAQLAYETHSQMQRDRWLQSMSRQYATWRQTLVSATAAASSIGFAAGAATGTVLAGAASLTQGVATGIATAVRGAPGLDVLRPVHLPQLQADTGHTGATHVGHTEDQGLKSVHFPGFLLLRRSSLTVYPKPRVFRIWVPFLAAVPPIWGTQLGGAANKHMRMQAVRRIRHLGQNLCECLQER